MLLIAKKQVEWVYNSKRERKKEVEEKKAFEKLTGGRNSIGIESDRLIITGCCMRDGWNDPHALRTISSSPLVRRVSEEKCNKQRHVASSITI